MNATPERLRAGFVLLAATLCLSACNETKTPTEPTEPASQPASLSGKVNSSVRLESAIVSCQGKSARAADDGSYSLTGLVSGPARATMTYSYLELNGDPTTGYDTRYLVLQPGANALDFSTY